MSASSKSLPQSHERPRAVHAISRKNGAPLKKVQALTASESAPTAESSSSKKKRHSPFRIKAGCIVALRYRAGGNNLKRIGPSGQELTVGGEPRAEVWTDPLPGRDEGLALIGRRVRCCFPKSVLAQEDRPATTRIVEGEIISIVDYEAQWEMQRERRRRRQPSATTVELLVDRTVLSAVPFLERTDEDVDVSAMSAKEKKLHHLEGIIRGKEKVTVKVNLADSSRISFGKDASQETDAPVAKWVVRKRMALPAQQSKDLVVEDVSSASNGQKEKSDEPAKSENGSEPTKKQRKKKKVKEDAVSLYVGDGNDEEAQQERNWRWLAGRYDDMRISSGGSILASGRPDELSFGFVGEVLKVSPSLSATETPATLAMVTIRRMILPEHTVSGRLSHHRPHDIFDEAGPFRTSDDKSEGTEIQYTFQAPVEELVIIHRRFERRQDVISRSNAGNSNGNRLGCPVVRWAYSLLSDSYKNLLPSDPSDMTAANTGSAVPALDTCHRCRKLEMKGTMKCICLTTGDETERRLVCGDCRKALGSSPREQTAIQCDCRSCTRYYSLVDSKAFKSNVEKGFANHRQGKGESDPTTEWAYSAIHSMRPTDFALPSSFLNLESMTWPSEKPISLSKTKRGKPRGGKAQRKPPGSKGRKSKTSKGEADQSPRNGESESEQVEDNVFVPSCSRLIPYDPSRKRFNAAPKQQTHMDDGRPSSGEATPRRAETSRTLATKQTSRKRVREVDTVEKKATGRAARAHQRRIMKGVAAIGVSGLGLDALAGREQQLRFDRSSIHAWGVFADEDINAGDMIVEYRGELIGNAVAEKREREYEKAKIGSDYMFRIDGFLVCDATKQGNVARFINASCDPNCYTQIITLNGSKRIVIYAKRDIQAGEELCYDYKFPFEFDETKRIKCHCGAQDCRGFMNWVRISCFALKACLPLQSYRGFTFRFVRTSVTLRCRCNNWGLHRPKSPRCAREKFRVITGICLIRCFVAHYHCRAKVL